MERKSAATPWQRVDVAPFIVDGGKLLAEVCHKHLVVQPFAAK